MWSELFSPPEFPLFRSIFQHTEIDYTSALVITDFFLFLPELRHAL